MTARAKMCGDKATFWNRGRAEAHATKFGQRVYECPICFCWHCTSKENWRDEYIDPQEAKRQVVKREVELRTEFNVIKRALNLRIAELEKENSRLRLTTNDIEDEPSA